jgi:hypothetical protein
VSRGLGDLEGFSSPGVEHSWPALHDSRNFDQVRDEHVVEIRRYDRRCVRTLRTRSQDTVVNRSELRVAPDLQVAGSAFLAACPLADLLQHLAGPLARGLAGLRLLAGQGVESLVRVLGPLLGVENGPDARVELGHLLLVGVPAALLLIGQGTVLLGSRLSDGLGVIPDVHAPVAEPLCDF